MIGRRQVFWERKKGGGTKCRGESRVAKWESITEASKALKRVPKGIKQAIVKLNMGLGTSPVLTDLSAGLLNPVFSGPSMFEVGEGSLAGEGGLAEARLMVELESGVTARCAMSLSEANAYFFVGSSSEEPSLPSGEADGSSLTNTSSDELMLYPGKADGPFYRGTSFDELTASLDKADDPFSAGISSVEPSLFPGKSADSFSAETCSYELTLSLGKLDKVFSQPSVECFLSDFFSELIAGWTCGFGG